MTQAGKLRTISRRRALAYGGASIALAGSLRQGGIAAQTPEAAEGPRTIEHALGTTEITGTPSRIVALEFTYVDALASLGISPVGIADDGDPERIIPQIRSQIDEWTSVGTRAEPDLELILSLDPDLIIADLARHEQVYENLSRIAPTIVLDSFEAGYAATLESIRLVGQALNREDEMERRLDDHAERMETLAARTPADEERKVMAAVATADVFSVHTPGAFTPDVLVELGLPYAVEEGASDEAYLSIGLEQLLEFNPDVLFLMVAEGEQTILDDWTGSDIWKFLSAVEHDQVYEVDRNLWSRSRGVISAESIAEDALTVLYGE